MTASDLTDEKLVALIRAGDQELYGEIIRRYQTKLSHYLKKFIRQPDELEDVLQEVFIRAYQNLYGFNVNKKFSSWIFRIAHNQALNQLKKKSKETLFLEAGEYNIIDEKINLEYGVNSELDRRNLEAALNLIGEKYRQPLILFFLETKTYEEISEILRLPPSSVGVLIMRGKKILKKHLEKLYGK